jgi:uncharacterized integral membrane protein (TIGR00698 family)
VRHELGLWARRAGPLVPGLLLCAAIAAGALTLQALERRLLGYPYLDAVVAAILGGVALRTWWQPNARWRGGIAFCAKTVLEIAIVLLGASISFGAVAAFGLPLLLAIAVTVLAALVAGYGFSRLLNLPPRLAVLIAFGNAICGNSAIAAVAPVIGARAEEVASSIAYTAILGVLVVLSLPLLVPLAGLSGPQYGVVAGLTVYAVPQVLAATLPVGLASVQIGTLVKLVRVLMLGPMVLAASLWMRARAPAGTARVPLVPWFILGFLVMAAIRSLGLMPDAAVSAATTLATLLTIAAMAALGLGVDVRVLGRAGGRVTLAVVASLVLLLAISLLLVHTLPLG